MKAPASQTDLPLQAFRYLAGEMDPAEAEAFERLLAGDGAVQQALVEAVQISAALQVNAAAPPASRPLVRTVRVSAPTRRWSVALALGGCAVVAATLLVALRDDTTPGAATAQNAGAVATVEAWSELGPENDVIPLDDASLMFADESTDATDTVPDWLLAAVADGPADGNEDSTPARNELRKIDEEI